MIGSDLQREYIESYMDWWSIAGADFAFSANPVNQFVVPHVQGAGLAAEKPQHQRVMSQQPAKSVSPLVAVAKPVPQALMLPDTLPDFQNWLASNALVPGAKWSPARALPHGPANSRLMVIGDQPDASDISASRIFTGAAGDLLDAMLSAIGMVPDQVYKSSFVLTRPMPGAMTDRDKEQLAHIARKHIALVNPDFVLILGRSTGLALLGLDVTIPTQSLREINHISGSVPFIGTFHPRAMLNQPALKKQAWQALKILQAALQATG